MSAPPPSSAPPGGGLRESVIPLEGRRRAGELRLSALGAVLEGHRRLAEPLRVPLGTLQLGLVERGPRNAGAGEGRFPILRRLGPTAVVPRGEGVEGWLWTGAGGSALTVLGEEGDAPNAALLFTKPLPEELVRRAFVPSAVADIAARSPLGAPAVYGLLFRVAEPQVAETVFRQYRLLRPVTDREVPPTLRRSLPTDRHPDPVVRGVATRPAAASVPPPR